ncbi:MAG: hypothetical protein KBT46_09785 [Ruminococcus sp.]|nr:hypothetical protein [Candidatus Copronaster equi]
MNPEIKKQAMTKRELYESQVKTLRLFLERNAISQAQYDKSYKDLTEKMGFSTPEESK